MKRMIIGLLLLVFMLAGMMNVHAADAQITVEVCASKTEVQVGETVEFTVLVTGSGVVAMQFELRMPEGLRYVPNSGATPENLAQKLGVPAADWTEMSKMFTFYNDVGITFAKGTQILRFSCVAEKEGTWTPELYELLPFNEEFEEFPPDTLFQQVTVTAQTQQTVPTVPEQSTDSVIPETEPPVTSPEPQPTTDSMNNETPADTVTVPDGQGNEGPELPPPDQVVDIPDDKLPSDPSGELRDDVLTVGPLDPTVPDQDLQNQEIPSKKALIWLLPLGLVALIGGGIAVFILCKKKA